MKYLSGLVVALLATPVVIVKGETGSDKFAELEARTGGRTGRRYDNARRHVRRPATLVNRLSLGGLADKAGALDATKPDRLDDDPGRYPSRLEGGRQDWAERRWRHERYRSSATSDRRIN